MDCQATFKKHCTFPKCDCDRGVSQSWLRTYDAHEGPVQDRIWIENNPGKFDGIAERENRICPKGVARRRCPYNPKLGCDCGYRKARDGAT